MKKESKRIQLKIQYRLSGLYILITGYQMPELKDLSTLTEKQQKDNSQLVLTWKGSKAEPDQ